jgi:hypothetical protein
MFYKERETTMNTLEALRGDLCCYMGPICDCKYGYKAADKLGSFHPGWSMDRGEQTGCPELRTAIALLNLMTDEEYETIMKRLPKNVSLDEIKKALEGFNVPRVSC